MREDGVDDATERVIRANGVGIHYLEWGAGGRPALVLLHGGGQSAWTWQRVATRFAPGYTVLAPDLRGHGDTDWSSGGAYSLDDFREDLRAFVDALVGDRFVLVGMSLGGMVALSYAGSYGERLAALVLVDIAPEVEAAGRERIVSFMTGRESFASLEEAVAYARAFNPRRSPEQLRQTLPRNLRALPDGRLAWKWDPAFLGAGEEPERRLGLAGLWDAAAATPCPTLVVHGVESDILSRETGERLARTLPRGRVVSVAGAGHAVQGDNPRSLADVIEGFLGEIGYGQADDERLAPP